jgi:hypothetical protein
VLLPSDSATGLKAWPRGVRPLGCSLDFALLRSE